MSAQRCSPHRFIDGSQQPPRSRMVCRVHGSAWSYAEMTCETTLMVERVLVERAAQWRRYGDREHRLVEGAGPEVRWLLPYTTRSAAEVEADLRADYEDFEEETGLPTRVHLLREEVAEAIAEPDPRKRVVELLQVAALAVQQAEAIERELRN